MDGSIRPVSFRSLFLADRSNYIEMTPYDTPSYCTVAGCRNLVRGGGKCGVCRKRASARKLERDSARPNSHQRGYDAAWKNLRTEVLRAQPWCCVRGCTRRSEQVDHVISVRNAPDRRLDPLNLRAMCASHHSARTATEQSKGWGRKRKNA